MAAAASGPGGLSAKLGDLTADVASPPEPGTCFNIIGGPMGALDEESARELSKYILSGERTHYTSAKLGSWAHSDASMRVLGEALAKCPGLTSVDLGNIVAGRMEAEALAAYKALADALEAHKGQLKVLDFSYNAIGPKGMVPLRGLLTEQGALEELIMVANGISAETQEDLANLLLFRGEHTEEGAVPEGLHTRLTRLVFDNNMAGNGGAEAMARIVRHSPHLTEFQMSASRIATEGGSSLLSALLETNLKGLRRLDLHDNLFGASCWEKIAQLVSAGQSPLLEEVDLRDLAMGDEGVREVVASILDVEGSPRQVRPIRSVRLSGNDISQDGEAVPAVCALIVMLPALEELMLGDNELGCAVEALGRALCQRASAGLPPLKVLSVDTNYVHPTAMGKLVKAGLDSGLGELEMGGNFASEETLEGWRESAAERGGMMQVTAANGDMEEEEEAEEVEAEGSYEPCGAFAWEGEPSGALDDLAEELSAAL
jgi:Ran GTPase-activating protein 1